jgi:hypothetical protein
MVANLNQATPYKRGDRHLFETNILYVHNHTHTTCVHIHIRKQTSLHDLYLRYLFNPFFHVRLTDHLPTTCVVPFEGKR